MNEVRCVDCVHFQEQERGSTQGPKTVTSYALCQAQTVYLKGASNVPPGAQTTDEPIGKAYVITKNSLIPHCEHARRK